MDTGLDGDSDGKTDRVAVDIVRPREPAAQGRKVPVIMDASPYYSCCGRGNESQRKTYDANGNVVQMPLFYDNYFVPRGYAFVGVDLAGTNRSDGCVDVGGRSDVQSAKAVVDWLNGRAKGYTSRTGTEPRQGDLDQRQDRHDRQELRRHDRQRRRRHRGQGPEDDRPDQRHLLLVRLLLRQGRPPLRLRPRMAVRLRREPGRPRQVRRRTAEDRRRSPAHRRPDPLLDRARLREGRPEGQGQRLRHPRPAGPQRPPQALRPVVGRPREARRRAQDLALPDRPRRPLRLPPRHLGRHPAPLVRPRTPRLRQRHRRRAHGRHRTPPRPVGHLGRLAAPHHAHREPAPRHRRTARRRHPGPAGAVRHGEVHRRPEPERDRLVGADRQPDTRQGRLHHQAARPRPCACPARPR